MDDPVTEASYEGTYAGRVAALRAELARRGLAGFVVPRADEHQGEYVPARAQRLAWLTGFTGSAGQAVVLRDEAAIFVDGRYTLQVAAEVDTSVFRPLHITETPPEDWLAERLPAGARLGIDPWLHTTDQVRRLRAACERAGATLVACETNPLDAVWKDQPPPPLAPVVPHDARFAGRASREKRADLAAALASDTIAAAVLSAPDSIAWLLNVRGADVPCTPLPLSFAILHADGSVDWFVDSRKLTAEVAQHVGPEVRVRPPQVLDAVLDDLGRRKLKVLVDPASAPAYVHDRLSGAGARVHRAADPCALPKARKNAVELEGFRAAHRRDGAALVRFLAWLAREVPSGTVTEMAAAERLEEFRRENERFQGPSFSTIAGSGPHGAIVHYRASEKSDRALRMGELFLLDSGAQYTDGTTDVTRTIALGAPGEEPRRRFTLVLKGHIALAAVVFPKGTTGSQLDVLARAALWRHGFDYDHGTGHGVGSYLSVHEGPHRVSKVPNKVALEPGMVLSNEPGYYKTGAYGIRIENLIAVTEPQAVPGGEREMMGFETLTLAPIDRTLIEPSLMTEEEIAWLDAYHARVRAALAPALDAETATWLEAATRPLRA